MADLELRAYVIGEVVRLEGMQRELQERLEATQRRLEREIAAVAGGIEAYRDVLRALDTQEAADGVDRTDDVD